MSAYLLVRRKADNLFAKHLRELPVPDGWEAADQYAPLGQPPLAGYDDDGQMSRKLLTLPHAITVEAREARKRG